MAEMMDIPADTARRLGWLRVAAARLRERTLAGLRAESAERLAEAVGMRGGDLVYRLDEHAEEALLAVCEEWGREEPFLLIAEGLECGRRIFPADVAAD